MEAATAQPPADDLYDPELHGDNEPPAAGRFMAVAIGLAFAVIIVVGALKIAAFFS